MTAYRNVTIVDFEFTTGRGDIPRPHCLVAIDYYTGGVTRQWSNEFGTQPPYPCGDEDLVVAFYGSAEIGCHLALGWPEPINVLDLYTAFRNYTNGLLEEPVDGKLTGKQQARGLLDALKYFRIPSVDAVYKKAQREIAIRGAPFTDEEKAGLLEYCESDVREEVALLKTMLPLISNLDQEIYRGEFMKAAAHIEHVGIPIDTTIRSQFSTRWDGIKRRTIAGVDTFYETDLYAGAAELNQEKFALLLKRENLGWDIDDSRNPPRLKTDKETFRTMAKANQYWQPLHEAQQMLGGMRLNDLQVGDDGYNRVLISPFASRTGRCQPSSAKFVFGPSRCYRSLIKPPEGYGVAYIDWVQQEFGIAASLSQDANMKAAYKSKDSYIWFAIQAGAAPPGATKDTHSIIRNQFKSTVLGVQFGMGPYTLATRLGVPPIDAKHLLKVHQRRAIETAEHEARLRALEERVGTDEQRI